ncbi:methionyl-tRNA formyltransferase [Salinimicrobium sediminilitoris]|uniref:methionyl-tRNA formyltransferase n=1 Tax=Salinimicrobium sediminilitoris TaxID=2876715 RepID=UPI001E5DE210|nr:methionyl-tRNA formyltransferase [Salinimicrobium sediminilitoris]MCC8359135.1 methionyl-tRNA formyltransferase [Salinimicrobium sediminilitoris]
MRDLRIVFMGTPEFAVYSLKAIVEAGYNVVGVITAPDRPAGRGRKLQESAVKTYAKEQDLKILQPVNLKAEAFLEELKALEANLQVVVAFRMLPEAVWKMPEYGTFNLHASLLPQYRGAAPINWAIINGEKETGVSTFFIDEKIDTGEMIMQQKVAIESKESAGELHDKLMETGAELIIKTLEALQQGPVSTTSQKDIVELKSAYKLNRRNTRIDWEQPLETIFNLIRGLSPYPTAWTTLINGNDEVMLKIYKSEPEPAEHHYPVGKLLQEDKKIKVAVKNGFLVLQEIQLPGKKKMTIKDLLNGYEFYSNAKVV